MPTDLIRFPGDLITADLWNRMLGLVDGLSARLDAQEALVVPDVVGDLFPTALDEINRAQLGLNTVFDVAGAKGNPEDAQMATRIVIAQTPGPDERVASGARMTLLITAPKAVTPNAPTITAVAPATNAQVGQPLDITGTNFTGNVRVIIRNTQVTEFMMPAGSTTQIHIAKVPPFEGSPTPGTTKDIPITVRNDVGEGSFVVKFTEAAAPVPRPTVSNVQLVSATLLQVKGTNLTATGQETTVTMGGQQRPSVKQSDGSLLVSMPDAMAAAYANVSPTALANLKTVDQRDLLLVSITTNPILEFDSSFISEARPAAARSASPSPAPAAAVGGITPTLAVGGGGIPVGTIGTVGGAMLFTTKMKLFLKLSSNMAGLAAQDGVTHQVTGSNVRLLNRFGQQVMPAVDVNALQDFTVKVQVADQAGQFIVKFGSVPDNSVVVGQVLAGGGTFNRSANS